MSQPGGSSTTTTNSGPPPQFMQAYTGLVNQAQGVASTPYQQYQGNLVAPLSPDQQAAIGTIQNAQGVASPFINAAGQAIGQSTTPIWSNANQFSPSAVGQYESPYTSDVVHATQAEFANQNAQQQQGIIGNAISQGAWGGDRAGVAQGIAAGQQQLAQAPVIAGLENQGYAQALQEFNQQQGAQIGANEANNWLSSQAGYGLANLGNEALSTTLTGANAQLGVGGLEQQQAQQGLNIPYEQFIAQQAYPFQTTGWLGNIVEGLGGAAGGSSSTTTPGPSIGSQIGGAALAGAGILGQTGAFGSNGWLSNSFGGGGGGISPADLSSAAAFQSGAFSQVPAGTFGPFNARGGAIPHRAGGGILPPDVSMSIVPGAHGMGDTPAHPGMTHIFDSTGSTSTTEGGGDGGAAAIGDVIKVAGLVASFLKHGGHVPYHAGGGIVVPFPKPHVDAGRGIVPANDDRPWSEPHRLAAGGTTAPSLPASSSPMIASFLHSNGIDIPQLGTPQGGGIVGSSGAPATASAGANQPVNDYLSAVAATASKIPPMTFNPSFQPWIVPEAPPVQQASPNQNAPIGFGQGGEGTGGAGGNGEGENAAVGGAADVGGGADRGEGVSWRGGRLPHRADGGDTEVGTDEPPMDSWQQRGIVMPTQPEPAPAGPSSPPGETDVASDSDGQAPTVLANWSDGGRGIIGGGPQPGAHGRHSPWDTLTAAGLAIMGGSSPYAGVNIGRGGLAGVEFGEKQREREALEDLRKLQQEELAKYHRETTGVRQDRAATASDKVDVDRLKAENLDVYRSKYLAFRQAGHDDAEADKLATRDLQRDLGTRRGDIAQQNATTAAGRAATAQAQGQQRIDQRAQALLQSREFQEASQRLRSQSIDQGRVNNIMSNAARRVANDLTGKVTMQRAIDEQLKGREPIENQPAAAPAPAAAAAPAGGRPPLSSLLPVQ